MMAALGGHVEDGKNCPRSQYPNTPCMPELLTLRWLDRICKRIDLFLSWGGTYSIPMECLEYEMKKRQAAKPTIAAKLMPKLPSSCKGFFNSEEKRPLWGSYIAVEKEAARVHLFSQCADCHPTPSMFFVCSKLMFHGLWAASLDNFLFHGIIGSYFAEICPGCGSKYLNTAATRAAKVEPSRKRTIVYIQLLVVSIQSVSGGSVCIESH